MMNQSEVKRLFSYNPESGVLIWRISSKGIRKDKIAGSPDVHGHLQVRIQGKKYYAHRLIWLWMTGSWPTHEIDHRDLNPQNNKWNNLREATRAQNSHNKRKPDRNTSGYKGVSRGGKKWRARICYNNIRYLIGHFDSPEDAHKAYVKAAEEFFGEFARTE